MGVVRGRLAPSPDRRGRAGRRAAGARRAAHRASLGSPSRRAVTRAARGARRRRLGARAEARPRLHHRRSRLSPLGDARARTPARRARPLATSSSATTTSPTAAIPSRSASTRRRSRGSLGVVLLGDEAVDVELRGRRVQVVGVEPRSYAARTASARTARRDGSGPAHPPLPLPGDRASHPGCLPPRSRGASARGSDRRAVPRREAPARAPTRARRRGRLRLRRDEAPRLAGSRHDLRSLPALRASGGHGARCTIDVMESPRHLDRGSRSLRGRCGAGDRRGCRASTRGAAEVSGVPDETVEVDGSSRARVGCGGGGRRKRRCRTRVVEYLERMANLQVGSVDVVVERVGAPPAKR